MSFHSPSFHNLNKSTSFKNLRSDDKTDKEKAEKDKAEKERLEKYKNIGPPVRLKNVCEKALLDDPYTEYQLYQYVLDDVWYFYNDSLTQKVCIEYTFGSKSAIKPMGKTKIEKLPNGHKCTLILLPGKTEPFIKGTVGESQSNFTTLPLSVQPPSTGSWNSAPLPKHNRQEDIKAKTDKYKNIGPPMKLKKSNEKSIFDQQNTENQLFLYTQDDTWYFYNDGQSNNVQLEYTFGPLSTITPLGNTVMENVPGGFKCTLVVHPGQTEPFIKGNVNGYKSTYVTQPSKSRSFK